MVLVKNFWKNLPVIETRYRTINERDFCQNVQWTKFTNRKILGSFTESYLTEICARKTKWNLKSCNLHFSKDYEGWMFWGWKLGSKMLFGFSQLTKTNSLGMDNLEKIGWIIFRRVVKETYFSWAWTANCKLKVVGIIFKNSGNKKSSMWSCLFFPIFK